MRPSDLPLPSGYVIRRTEQWEYTMWTPDGECLTAGSDLTLRLFACGIETGKQLMRDAVDDFNIGCECFEMTCAGVGACDCHDCHPPR